MINGSPKRDGNTAQALQEMEKIFTQEGVEAELIHVGTQDIRGCIACGGCMRQGKCVFDDLVNELAEKFQKADGMVVASPVYYASPNATLIALLDRLFHSTLFDKRMKVGASVAVARRGGCSSTFDMLNKYFGGDGYDAVVEMYGEPFLKFLVMQAVAELYPDKRAFEVISGYGLFDKVCGTDYVRKVFSNRYRFEDIKDFWRKDEEAFRVLSEKYHIY